VALGDFFAAAAGLFFIATFFATAAGFTVLAFVPFDVAAGLVDFLIFDAIGRSCGKCLAVSRKSAVTRLVGDYAANRFTTLTAESDMLHLNEIASAKPFSRDP